MNRAIPHTEQLAADAPPLQVLIVGAGFAGVGAGIRLREAGIDNFLICEKAVGIGGTWWHNRYPGAACDIASHLYCYSFEPNPNWSRKFAPQAEIQAYIERCVDKYGIRDRIRLNTAVVSLDWEAERGLWRARLGDGSVRHSRHVIFASGGLHLPAYPDIPGRGDFRGPSMHSAEWDASVDFSGKRVAVIGSAASAIQLVPELARVAARIDVYQRTPNYIAPRLDRAFSEREKARFARWPWLGRLYRHYLFLRGEWLLFPVVKTRRRSRWRERLERMIRAHIRAEVAEPATAEALLPSYPMGCKRILIADDFYQALNRRNVELVTAGIERIAPEGVQTTGGELREADILVYATGFDLEGYMRAAVVRGRNGRLLSEEWADIPRAYKGGFVPGFPNFYFTTGPNTGVGTTSVVYMIEAQLELILQAIASTGDGSAIEVTEDAYQRYNAEIRAALQDTVWAGACQSWYKRADGEIASLYPFNARSYRRDHRQLERGDFRWHAVAAGHDVRPTTASADR
ncbi:flavin-containing monooxygenase [Parahaliea mediterranea]|uniref:NAD(P)/FAD-dependent oxidoreductase n=1 Tax=Parahaliea mediterranea TaxID=651086 RepID=A0A939DDP4_9GAMM|nr:NAD(P)/FAD-dependent oxidoreductase [Parahaliea mediterranea]MBN7796281.1 NAD(P)/FAD-dependent oxidoreductase [Parahaliea mediterranea]